MAYECMKIPNKGMLLLEKREKRKGEKEIRNKK
jgi:hypothetical protein